MAKRTKYLIAAAVTVVVLAVAIGMTVAVGLLAGALVLLVALVVTFVAVRFRVAKQEKAASADWVDAIGDTTIPDEDLDDWTPSPARSGRMIADPSVFAPPTSHGGAVPSPDTTEGFEALTDEALATNGDDTSWPGGDTTDTIDWSVPSEWGKGPIADDDRDGLEPIDEADAEVIPLNPVEPQDDVADAAEDDEWPVATTDETDPPEGTVLDNEPTNDAGPAATRRRPRPRRRCGPIRPAFRGPRTDRRAGEHPRTRTDCVAELRHRRRRHQRPPPGCHRLDRTGPHHRRARPHRRRHPRGQRRHGAAEPRPTGRRRRRDRSSPASWPRSRPASATTTEFPARGASAHCFGPRTFVVGSATA